MTEIFIHSFENTFNPPSISFILSGASAANVEKSHEEDKAHHFARHYKRTGMCRVLFDLWDKFSLNFSFIQ